MSGAQGHVLLKVPAGLAYLEPWRLRKPGWEHRISDLVEFARARPYELGVHDCFRFALAAVESLVGVDLWPQFQGRYRTRRESLALIAVYGSSFSAAFSAFFGREASPMVWARRGDICEYRDDAGERHLGVLIGARVAVLAETGLVFRARSACAHCWRIG